MFMTFQQVDSPSSSSSTVWVLLSRHFLTTEAEECEESEGDEIFLTLHVHRCLAIRML